MKQVAGIGGFFFKANDPDKLREWYRAHLGIKAEKDGGAVFKWQHVDAPNQQRYTVWSPFPRDTDYFKPSEKPFMINFQVENLDALLAQLKAEGGWIMDPQGNQIELWEPPRAGTTAKP